MKIVVGCEAITAYFFWIFCLSIKFEVEFSIDKPTVSSNLFDGMIRTNQIITVLFLQGVNRIFQARTSI